MRPDGARLVEAIVADRVDDEVRALPARHNLAPTDPVGVLWAEDRQRRLSVARWGVPRRRGGGGLAINARDDRLRGGMWRSLWSRGRAVIPLAGFYEWEGPHRQPWYFHRGDDQLLLLAALVQHDDAQRHATIITTTPSADIGGIHDRMPVVLEPDMVDPWLLDPGLLEPDPDALASLVRPAPAGTLVRHAVSSRVNNVRNDGPQLLEPVTPAAVQVELF